MRPAVAAAGTWAAVSSDPGAGAASSGGCVRFSPSRSALRRTRSACASSMLEEWLVTPMPIDRASSRPSLLVRPSSRASSYTRIFLAKFLVSTFLRPSVLQFFVLLAATCCGGVISQPHPRTFRDHREHQFNVGHADVGPQGPAEGAPTTGSADAVGLGQLGSSEPTKPSTSALAFSVDYELASGAQDYSDQCTGALSSAAAYAGPDGGWRLPHSFP